MLLSLLYNKVWGGDTTLPRGAAVPAVRWRRRGGCRRAVPCHAVPYHAMLCCAVQVLRFAKLKMAEALHALQDDGLVRLLNNGKPYAEVGGVLG